MNNKTPKDSPENVLDCRKILLCILGQDLYHITKFTKSQ